uniref:ladderlectin-like isoform X2 n=1 Tax=Gasterosteus aculeatus aculeatus TaxID=481459 RepID=UPI001A99F0BA|nr:ladderlectin-like isoform X2 [Gasterosteus aculeatus aculeatus]
MSVSQLRPKTLLVFVLTTIPLRTWTCPQDIGEEDKSQRKIHLNVRRGSSERPEHIWAGLHLQLLHHLVTMKTLTLTVLLCAVMTLTRAAERHLVRTSSSCPRGWTKTAGRCFRDIPTAASGAQAQRGCLSLGGHLTSAHSVQEYQDIQTIVFSSRSRHPATRIRGSHAREEALWFWSDGTYLDHPIWAPGEPFN